MNPFAVHRVGAQQEFERQSGNHIFWPDCGSGIDNS